MKGDDWKAAAGLKRKGFDLVAISQDTCGSHVKYAAKMAIKLAKRIWLEPGSVRPKFKNN